MRHPFPESAEKGRIVTGRMRSTQKEMGNNGAFILRYKSVSFFVIASDGMGWEHVSISPTTEKRCPTWEEMCYFKDLFWGEDECVIQYHPPKSEYINMHPYVLHLWKQIGVDIPLPPSETVGFK